MPKITQARREERRDEIVEAALRCFARTGYQRTSMAEIIAESGLSAGAIYSYFPSKQELIRSVATRILDDRRSELESAGAARAVSPAEMVSMLVEGVRANAPLPVLIQAWAEATVDPELRMVMQDVLPRVRSTLVAGLTRWARANPDSARPSPEEWARVSAPVLMSLIPGFVLQSVLIDDFDPDEFVEGLTGLLPAAG